MNHVSLMHYVYVLQNNTGRIYTGYTSDLRRRLTEHTSGKSTYTKHTGPYNLIYYEACIDSEDAQRRERYLKSGAGKYFIKSRLRKYIEKGLT